ncbi:MAG TPA: hypothetical protein VNM48_15710 [Chloroflexota bacterium]|nr:hypothetical protein [Chloroflexota bacterium]
MAGSKSDFYENRVLNLALRAATLTPAITPYVALFTGTLTGDTPGTEVTLGAYARVSAPATTWGPTSTAAGDSTAATLTNAVAITFPLPTANWGTITHMGIFDAATAGNALYYADLTTARTINSGDSAPSFAPGVLTLSEQ